MPPFCVCVCAQSVSLFNSCVCRKHHDEILSVKWFNLRWLCNRRVFGFNQYVIFVSETNDDDENRKLEKNIKK